MNNKTHFRKVFKSDHLGSADLEEMMEEGKSLVFTISHVTQHLIEEGGGVKVAGKMISANIAHFKEKIKPMVLNSTNSNIVKKFAGGVPWVEDWRNINIELYIDHNVKMKGQVVGGVRIKENPPKTFSQKEVDVIKARIIAATTLEELTTIYNSDITIKTNKDIVKFLSERKKELSL